MSKKKKDTPISYEVVWADKNILYVYDSGYRYEDDEDILYVPNEINKVFSIVSLSGCAAMIYRLNIHSCMCTHVNTDKNGHYFGNAEKWIAEKRKLLLEAVT